MKEESLTFKKHLFVCTFQREGSASCYPKGANQIVDELKKWVKDENLASEVKVSRSGCLGLCEKGIAAVCYPEGKWLSEIKVNDIERLKKGLL
jgi:(2Fe-2S) ferredoxin